MCVKPFFYFFFSHFFFLRRAAGERISVFMATMLILAGETYYNQEKLCSEPGKYQP
jgi:hypothetical protein